MFLADQKSYLTALESATKRWLLIEEDRNRTFAAVHARLPEPITGLARRYLRDLDLNDAAHELGLPSGDRLRELLTDRPAASHPGIVALLGGGKLPRVQWEKVETDASLFQRVARELDLGTPKRTP